MVDSPNATRFFVDGIFLRTSRTTGTSMIKHPLCIDIDYVQILQEGG